MAGRDESRASGYRIDLSPSFEPVLDLWNDLAVTGDATPFQSRAWLEAWTQTFGRDPGTRMIAATVRDASGAAVLALPLVWRRVGLLSSIEFADGGVTDYNAPIVGTGAPSTPAEASRLWRALLKALPRSDVIHFERMPYRIGERLNPLGLLASARPANVAGLALALPNGYAAWRHALPRRFRMELGRCDRLFEAMRKTSFERVDGGGSDVHLALERLQKERIAALDLTYTLDDATPKAFYRRLADQPGALTALTAEGVVVAVLLGLRHADRFVMLRIASDDAYARLSPGRSIITRTMDALNADGVTVFDFALGDYAYKRRLGGEPVDLREILVARSPLGLNEAAMFRAKAFIRADPRRLALAKRLRALATGLRR